jgi:O-antigen ligase/tetratricopeptide (TPR) repeat protein
MPAESNLSNPESSDDRLPLTRYLRVGGEALLYFILALSPWAFGGVEPAWQLVIAIAIGVLTCLWLGRCLIYRRITIRPDGVTLGLGVLLCLSVFQLIPLPAGLVSLLSPARAEAHRVLVPESLERIGPEDPEATRAAFIPLTADSSLTKHFLADLFLCLAVYLVARNWLATRGSIRRMAAVMAANGVALALYSLAQLFLSNGLIYWTYPLSTAFGPFVCRNHYPFYAYLTLGLTVGLLLNQAKSEYSTVTGKGLTRAFQTLVAWLGNVSTSLGAVLLLAAAAIIAVSIPFSLSRGGVLTLVAAGTFAAFVATGAGLNRNSLAGVTAAGLVAAAVLGVAAWVGWGPIEKRFLSGDEVLIDNRSDLWADAARLVSRYPIFGCGNNAYLRVEPTVRRPNRDLLTNLVNDSVHNEYLEALVEGGPLRFAATLLLAIAPVAAAVGAYRRLQSRSVGSIALGMAFGLFAVAVHSAFDFGIHLPAVALLAVTVAAYARAAVADPDFHPSRRTKTSGRDTVGVTEFDDPKSMRVRTSTLLGPPALAAAAVVFIGTGLIVRQYWLWDRADRYATAATVAAGETGADRHERRIAFAGARAGLAPDDPEAHAALARAHFDAVVAIIPTTAPTSAWVPDVPPDLVERHVRPGLRAAKRARDASPYLASSHMRFALYRHYCVSADSSKAYLARVLSLTPSDPEAFFAAGVEAHSRNDRTAASAHWKTSLAISGRQLGPILTIASPSYSPSEIVEKILPDDPAVLYDAAGLLYPDRQTQRAERAVLLTRAKKIGTGLARPDVKVLTALARVEYEIGDRDAALTAWRRAVDAAPRDGSLRQQYALWLEEEELYEPLVSELEWLRVNGAGGANIVDRLDAARHALDLKQILDK